MHLMRNVLLFFSSLAVVMTAGAGTIVGHVTARGAELPGGSGGSDAYASRRYKYVERIDYDRLADFVIYIDQPVGAPPPADRPATVVQKDAAFDPHVLPVMVGTAVRWPNEDDIYHNVFSMSDAKEFNLGLYKESAGSAPAVMFDKLGRVDVFCGIHSKMHCIILVVPSAYFAVANDRGRYRIENVPPGTYKLKAWHERLPSQVREITVPADGEVTVDFELSLAGAKAD